MGIDIHEVIRAAATKPFGFTPYYPGPGLGGHCIPIDPFYLTLKSPDDPLRLGRGQDSLTLKPPDDPLPTGRRAFQP